MRRVDPRRLVFLDESGANVAMGRTHAWTLKGQVLVDPRPMNWGNNLTMIGALRCDGWLTLSTMFQTANKERFVSWMRRRLLPKLRSGDIVVLDNAAAHKDVRIAPLLRSKGAALRYLPPYSPDFNPIEPGWSLIKKGIRACAPRTRVALRRVAQNARRRVSKIHCRRWAKHSGYRADSNDLWD
jgi:transposase